MEEWAWEATGKWKPWNDPKHPRHAPSPDADPSTRTPAAKQSQAKAAEKAARHKLAESEKARKAAEKEIKELRAAAAGDSSDPTTDADDQGKPNAELKKKLTELGDEESDYKKWLAKRADDKAMAGRLAAIQTEMAAVRNQM